VPPLVIAFYRCLFAGLAFAPWIRRQHVSWSWGLLPVVGSFAAMNALFVSALGLGTAANAIFLQYTAPVWLLLGSVWLLGETVSRWTIWTVSLAMAGVGIIVAGAWGSEDLFAAGIALGSGIAYAGVILGLRYLRDRATHWLTLCNHWAAALVLLPVVWMYPAPRTEQIVFLAFFGTVQMALPYWLVARGLRQLSPQEVGMLSLLEPVLNPVWAYLVAGERPASATLWGGACILWALVLRYAPGLLGRNY